MSVLFGYLMTSASGFLISSFSSYLQFCFLIVAICSLYYPRKKLFIKGLKMVKRGRAVDGFYHRN